MTDARRIAKKYAKEVVGLDAAGAEDYILEAIREAGRLYLQNTRKLVEDRCWIGNEYTPQCRYCLQWRGKDHSETCIISAIKFTEDVLEAQNAANNYLLHKTPRTKTRPSR
jgi:hypothetical protein